MYKHSEWIETERNSNVVIIHNRENREKPSVINERWKAVDV